MKTMGVEEGLIVVSRGEAKQATKPSPYEAKALHLGLDDDISYGDR